MCRARSTNCMSAVRGCVISPLNGRSKEHHQCRIFLRLVLLFEMEQIIVRTAGSTDLETLLQFEQAMIVAERPFDETIRLGEGVRYYDLGGLIAAPNVEIVVAEHDSQIIGCGYARIE